MSLNPLSMATDGLISSTAKKALIIAVAGYLNFSTPVVPVSEGGGGHDIVSVDYRKVKHERILQEDREILLMIKAIVEHELL